MKTTDQIHSMISFAPSEDAIGIDTLVDFLYDATASDIANLYQILQNHQAGSCEPHEFVGIGGLCDICNGGKKFLIHSGIKV
jgi:hypothetical protein